MTSGRNVVLIEKLGSEPEGAFKQGLLARGSTVSGVTRTWMDGLRDSIHDESYGG